MKSVGQLLPQDLQPQLTCDDAHVYRLGQRILPSVTEVLRDAGIVSLDWYTEFARDRGSAIHFATRYYDEGNLDESTVDPRIRGYLDAWITFRDEIGFDPETIEQPMYHSTHLYAGTPDRIGTARDGSHLLVDLKSGQVAESHPLQLAAYQALIGDQAARYRRIVVRLKPTGKYAVDEFPLNEYGRDWGAFLACLTLYNWKRRIK